MKHVTIVGAGLAGATAAALLRKTHTVTVLETRHRCGGLCDDADGYQQFGPHAFHTDSDAVWRFLGHFARFQHYDHHAYTLCDHPHLAELPRRFDPAFRYYSEKAWGVPWDELPESVRERVPTTCTDSRVGYHDGKYKAQPALGYSAMIARMLAGCDVKYGVPHDAWRSCKPPIVYTGRLPDVPYIHRRFLHTTGRLPKPIVNYGTHAVPQLRSWDNAQFGIPYYRNIVSHEFFSATHVPCYPIESVVDQAKQRQSEMDCITTGRMGGYRYLDMDSTVAQVAEDLIHAGLITKQDWLTWHQP